MNVDRSSYRTETAQKVSEEMAANIGTSFSSQSSLAWQIIANFQMQAVLLSVCQLCCQESEKLNCNHTITSTLLRDLVNLSWHGTADILW